MIHARSSGLLDPAKAQATLDRAQKKGVLSDEKAFLALAHGLLEEDKPDECAGPD